MRPERRSDWLCIGTLAVLAVGMLWPVTVGGRLMAPADMLLLADPWYAHAGRFADFSGTVHNPILDAINQFYPWRAYARAQLLQGEVPLWNPHQYCGMPFVGNNSSAVFYPETWLHCLMPTERALGWASALYLFLAGAFMFGFLRTIGCRHVAGLLGAVAFMANGFFVGWLCFPSLRSVYGWLPLILLAYERGVRTRGWGWIALMGLGVGMQFLAGHLHISLYLLMTAALYVGWRTVSDWRAGEQAVARWGLFALGVSLLLGTGLAACQLLPTLEFGSLTERTASYADQLKYRLPLSYIALGLIPNLMGNPVDGNHWGHAISESQRAFSESCWYVGVGTWLLAFIALVIRRRDQAWFWLALFGVGWLLALGSNLNAPLYYLVPGYRWLHGIGRAIILPTTALCVLAALGMEALLEQSESPGADRRRSRGLLEAILTSAAGLVLFGFLAAVITRSFIRSAGLLAALPELGHYTDAQVLRFFALLGGAVALALLCRTSARHAAALALVALVALDLGLFLRHYTPAANPAWTQVRTATIPALARPEEQPHRFLSIGTDETRPGGVSRAPFRRLMPNQAMRLGLEDIQGTDSFVIATFQRLLEAASREYHGFRQPDWRLPLMELLGVRDVISRTPLPETDRYRKLSGTYEVCIYRTEQALPRAFVPARVRAVASDEEALRLVASPDFDPAGEAIASAAEHSAAMASARSLTLVSDQSTNRLTITHSSPWSGLTVISNAWYPGWRAFADGRELRVGRVDYALTGVEVCGAARVDLIYLPASFTVGAFVSCLCAGALVALGVSGWRQRHV